MIELKLNLLLNAQDVLSQWTIMLHAGRGELLYPNGLSVNQKEKMAAYVKPLIQELKKSEFDYCRLGCERLLGTLSERETDPIMIVGGVDDLRRRMSGLSELMTCLFLSTKERELYEPRMPLFGTAFETKFASGGAFELDEAAKCLALERGTASVFSPYAADGNCSTCCRVLSRDTRSNPGGSSLGQDLTANTRWY